MNSSPRKVRDIIGTLFQSPMQNMSFPTYFSYVNEAGKVTARSLMDLCAIALTVIEEQEKKNEQYEANFKDIEDILSKLVNKKVEKFGVTEEDVPSAVTLTLHDFPERRTGTITPVENIEAKSFKCDSCDREFNTQIALSGHKRSHKVDPLSTT